MVFKYYHYLECRMGRKATIQKNIKKSVLNELESQNPPDIIISSGRRTAALAISIVVSPALASVSRTG